jgi:hypothetical protein
VVGAGIHSGDQHGSSSAQGGWVVSGRAAVGAGAALCAVTAMSLATAGLANASSPPDVNGKTYSDASSALSSAGFTPVVSTTVGDQKSWPDCLVTNVVSRSVPAPENSSGSATNEALVSLNCYSAEASAKGSGYSAASPEGKAIVAAAKAKADAAKAATPAS